MTSPHAATPRMTSGGGWTAVIEGFYGEPYRHEDRLALLAWMPGAGFTDYAYGPKGDPYHRGTWRDPYPADVLAQLQQTAVAARQAGIRLTLSVSPGLDWKGHEDHPALVSKLRQLHGLGVDSLGVYWDDVPPGGEDLGRSHGEGVAAAVRGFPADVRWMTCGTDYAMDAMTPYLTGFAQTLPAGLPIAWTGPDITSPVVTAELAAQLQEQLQHPLLLCDNWPVNDLGMSGQLHLGPAPYREPALRDVVAGIGFNAMALPLASRLPLEIGARHWHRPDEDREAAWREVLASHAGLTPLARACRSWVDTPGPDPELATWVDEALAGGDRLLDFLAAGCRSGLDSALAAEVAPWLDSWDAEAAVMVSSLLALRGELVDPEFNLGTDWLALHRRPAQVFGIRLALYGLSFRLEDRLLPDPASVVRGENLTDLLVRSGLEGLRRLTG